MKEDVVDVLLYLFESYVDNDLEPTDDRDALHSKLIDAGFHARDIEHAFSWLEDLSNTGKFHAPGEYSTRVYDTRELRKLDLPCRGFLQFLESRGILTATLREVVIDRVMALETDEIDVEQLRWLVLMVLYNLPDQEASCVWLEHLVLDRTDLLH
jgi:Smg protein